MVSILLKIVLCATFCITLQTASGDIPNCLPVTACDTHLASCTIGIDCLGSPITLCGLGDLTPNVGTCNFFANSTQQYCKCESCVGLLPELLVYDCSCNGDSNFQCDPGYILHTCVSKLNGPTQYACCKNGC